METGEDGPHLLAVPQDVEEEHKQEADFATILRPQMEENSVREHQRKLKNATLTNALVYFQSYASYNAVLKYKPV
jgi:hypothetical protein